MQRQRLPNLDSASGRRPHGHSRASRELRHRALHCVQFFAKIFDIASLSSNFMLLFGDRALLRLDHRVLFRMTWLEPWIAANATPASSVWAIVRLSCPTPNAA
jgi:hypothetical protein